MNALLRIPLILPLLLSGTTAQESGGFGSGIGLETIENFHRAKRQELEKPLEDLKAKYRGVLEKTRDDFQTAGNLDGIIATKKTLEEFDREIVPDGVSPDPTLQSLETIYLEQRGRILKEIEAPLRKTDEEAAAMLADLSTKLTKQGKIDEALKVRESLRAITGKTENVPPPTLPSAPSEPAEITINSASWHSRGKHADVTDRVKSLLTSKRDGFTPAGNMNVDPDPGWNKSLTIKFIKNGIARQLTWGRNETVRMELLAGPQDNAELEQWLAGTAWKVTSTELTFEGGGKFTMNDRSSHRWEVLEKNRVRLVWSPTETIEAAFNDTWTGFTEQAGNKRTFRKVK